MGQPRGGVHEFSNHPAPTNGGLILGRKMRRILRRTVKRARSVTRRTVVVALPHTDWTRTVGLVVVPEGNSHAITRHASDMACAITRTTSNHDLTSLLGAIRDRDAASRSGVSDYMHVGAHSGPNRSIRITQYSARIPTHQPLPGTAISPLALIVLPAKPFGDHLLLTTFLLAVGRSAPVFAFRGQSPVDADLLIVSRTVTGDIRPLTASWRPADSFTGLGTYAAVFCLVVIHFFL